MKNLKKRNKIPLYLAPVLIFSFVLWTFLVRFVDVEKIGPNNSSVGFATLNGAFSDLVGVNMTLYTITDWLGLVPFGVAFVFAFIGLFQWIKRKSILKVDCSILILGGFYIAVIAVYFLFEEMVINYRPVLIEGYLEASYPSSTTMLTASVMPTAIMQLSHRIKSKALKYTLSLSIIAFTSFMVIGRVISGVHWLTDIIGGALISAGLVMLYYALCDLFEK